MLGMDETIIDRIAFGGVKELEERYEPVFVKRKKATTTFFHTL
jgi:hypothetical protein